MAARFDRQDRFEVSADRLLCLMLDPAVQRDRALALGASRARCSRQQNADDVTIEVVETTATIWGSYDSTLTFCWNSQTREATWRRVIHRFEQRCRADGWSRIIDDGRSCQFQRCGEVEVYLPVVGRIIERKAIAAINEALVKEAAFVRQRLNQPRARKIPNTLVKP